MFEVFVAIAVLYAYMVEFNRQCITVTKNQIVVVNNEIKQEFASRMKLPFVKVGAIHPSELYEFVNMKSQHTNPDILAMDVANIFYYLRCCRKATLLEPGIHQMMEAVKGGGWIVALQSSCRIAIQSPNSQDDSVERVQVNMGDVVYVPPGWWSGSINLFTPILYCE